MMGVTMMLTQSSEGHKASGRNVTQIIKYRTVCLRDRLPQKVKTYFKMIYYDNNPSNQNHQASLPMVYTPLVP
jgi:hypothetical protein